MPPSTALEPPGEPAPGAAGYDGDPVGRGPADRRLHLTGVLRADHRDRRTGGRVARPVVAVLLDRGRVGDDHVTGQRRAQLLQRLPVHLHGAHATTPSATAGRLEFNRRGVTRRPSGGNVGRRITSRPLGKESSSMSSRTHATRRRLFSGVAGSGLSPAHSSSRPSPGPPPRPSGRPPRRPPAISGTASRTSSTSCSTTCTSDVTTRTCPSDLERMPALMNFLKEQRHDPVQHPHADDRPHGRRQPVASTPACTATGTASRCPTPTRPTTPTAPPTRPRRSPTGPARSPTPLATPTRGPRHDAVDGLQRHRAGQRRAEPADPGSVGPVHPRRLRRR